MDGAAEGTGKGGIENGSSSNSAAGCTESIPGYSDDNEPQGGCGKSSPEISAEEGFGGQEESVMKKESLRKCLAASEGYRLTFQVNVSQQVLYT